MIRGRLPLVLSFLVVVAAFSLLAAGCGGGSGSPGVASVAATTAATTTPQNALFAFATCMRSNGMPNFPDPQQLAGGHLKLTIQQFGASTSQFQSAMSACSHLLPTNGGSGPQETAAQQRTRLADGLSFAKCMRSHGVSRFPDPTAQGDLTVEMVEAQGIDVHSAAVLHVVQTCLPASHGALTPAKVAEALRNAGG